MPYILQRLFDEICARVYTIIKISFFLRRVFMAKIIEMSQHLADLIAAGEVVERPSSVVKELTENAIDAGASAITVEIKNGGMTYIRITDDGCGIAPDDVETAFLRHATSKLKTEEELSSIKTLGFRGEALAAVCAVSRIEMFTRERGAQEGTYIAIDGGIVTEKSPVGCPEGTTIIVRDLFFNTPARLKFMKKDSSEGAAVSAAVVRCALSHPELSIRYVKDEKEELHTPGDGRTDSCVYTALGREFSVSMLKTRASDGYATVEGFVSSPGGARGNRSHQFFFVNGRFVKSQLLQAALEQAYKNCLFSGRFPACVLHITINPGVVDVNVHPAKTEIKFLSERQVFDAVYYAVKTALGKEDEAAEIKIPKAAPAVPEKPEIRASEPMRTTPASVFVPKEASSFPGLREPVRPYNEGTSFKTSVRPESVRLSTMPEAVQTKIVMETIKEVAPPPVEPEAVPENPTYRIIGETMKEYIIVERGESLFLIDKHAAHERIIFDRLKAEKNEIMPQALLTPVIAEVGREEAALLLSHSALLNELGFDIEDYGSGSVAVNCAPTVAGSSGIAALLTEICEDIRLGGRPNSLGIKDEILASIACKAAIKAGRASEPGEYLPVAEKVMSGEVKYCPHGRPVAMELSKKTLDKNFKRT